MPTAAPCPKEPVDISTLGGGSVHVGMPLKMGGYMAQTQQIFF